MNTLSKEAFKAALDFKENDDLYHNILNNSDEYEVMHQAVFRSKDSNQFRVIPFCCLRLLPLLNDHINYINKITDPIKNNWDVIRSTASNPNNLKNLDIPSETKDYLTGKIKIGKSPIDKKGLRQIDDIKTSMLSSYLPLANVAGATTTCELLIFLFESLDIDADLLTPHKVDIKSDFIEWLNNSKRASSKSEIGKSYPNALKQYCLCESIDEHVFYLNAYRNHYEMPKVIKSVKNDSFKERYRSMGLKISYLNKGFITSALQALEDFLNKTHKRNRIVAGPPGTGKSYKINQDLKDKSIVDSQTIRMVCHPESTNAQFIGSYRPQSIKGQITYGFSEGPFTKLLKRALNNPAQSYVLVIEELNRANSAAMFAEAFQLLDRDAEGWSEHPTDLGDDVREFLELEEDESVRLPPNFAIWATMNTADQGVFPMDTAFKRRWSFEHIGVDEGFETWRHTPWDPQLPTANIHWQTFRLALNHALEQLEVEEDRLIGPFFLTKRELQEPETNVVSKVISYLRDDVLRYEPKGLFIGVNDKGEPDAEGRSPSFAWLKRQYAQTKDLLSLFKDRLSKSISFAQERRQKLESDLNAQDDHDAELTSVQDGLSDISNAQTPHDMLEERSVGES